MKKRLTIYTDGCSKGNPGPASIGVLVFEENDPHAVLRLSHEIGQTTNNQAEYRALISALEYAVNCCATEVEIRSDSELIVNQMKGLYRVRKAELMPLYRKAQQLAGLIEKFSIMSIPREQNREADKLANSALDQ